MNLKKLITHLNILYLLLVFAFINSKEKFGEYNYDLKNNIFSPLLYPNKFFVNKNIYNYQVNSSFEPEIINKIITAGHVQTELLYDEKIYNFKFSSNNENGLLIHFYPLDCQIELIEESNNIEIKTISNYEYNGYYAKIENEIAQNVNFKLKVLKNVLDDNNKNREFHLIINTLVKNNTLYELNINDKESFILNFNNNLNEVKLIYNLSHSGTYPIILSSFIKERVNFEIKVSNGEQELNRIVNYNDKFLIENNFFSNSDSDNIYISIKKIEEKDAVIIAKIIENPLIPNYLQKNFLNLGFIPNYATYQYYYMEVFKGEEGEIILNNKKYAGSLISKIIPKKNINEDDIIMNKVTFPDETEKSLSKTNKNYLVYNEHFQKLNFNSSQTNDCDDGCYILITYYSHLLNSKNKTQYIIGTEFTLLTRVWDEEEYKSQIINIPLNEYIFGDFENVKRSINNHYYTVFIPENTTNISIEMHTNNYYIFAYAKEGIIKINVLKPTQNSFLLIDIPESKHMIINLNHSELGMDSFKQRYISFAFSSHDFLEDLNYYFRIIQENSTNKQTIYPLDTNKVNLCQTNKNNDIYSCFFLINNEFKEISSRFILYGYGEKSISYTYWSLKREDIYNLDLNNITNEIEGTEWRDFLDIIYQTKSDYVLVRLESLSSEILKVSTNFDNNLRHPPILQVYSEQLFYLTTDYNRSYYFNFDLYDNYRIFINNTAGRGEMYFKDYITYNKYKTIISGKNVLSFVISKKTGSIHFHSIKNLVFNIKISPEIPNNILYELEIDNRYIHSDIDYELPIGYYIKDIKNEGVYINFYFKFNNSIIDNNYQDYKLKIRGYVIDYEDTKLITKMEYLIYKFTDFEIEGIFDESTNGGVISFDKEYFNIANNNNSKFEIKDKYCLIIINHYGITNFSIHLSVNSKDNSLNPLTINQYIRGYFDLLISKQIQEQKYYIQSHDNNLSDNYTIEFSSNYENIDLIFNNNITICHNKPIIIKGTKKYFITINYSTNISLNYFTVRVNNTKYKSNGNNDESLKKATYIIKYYNNDDNNDNNMDSIFDLTNKFIQRNNNKSSYNLILQNKNNKKFINFTDNYNCTFFLKLFK